MLACGARCWPVEPDAGLWSPMLARCWPVLAGAGPVAAARSTPGPEKTVATGKNRCDRKKPLRPEKTVATGKNRQPGITPGPGPASLNLPVAVRFA